MFALGTAVFIVVILLLVVALLVRGRRRTDAESQEPENGTRPILIGVGMVGTVHVE